jgi:imidazolonepropionase-like amidohydrolase
MACRQHGMFPSEAVVAATRTPRWRSGSLTASGSLEVGKDADLQIWDTDDYPRRPSTRIRPQIGLQMVLKGGKIVVANRLEKSRHKGKARRGV